MTKKTTKNGFIEFIRFFLALIICLYHWGEGRFKGGYLPISFFFVISGFFLCSHYENHKAELAANDIYTNCFAYLKGRVCKFYPHYFFAFVLSAIVWVFVAHGSTLHNFLLRSFWEITLLQNIGLSTTAQIANPASWYLSAMLIASYFIFFLLQKNDGFYIYIIAPLAVMFVTCYFNFKFHNAGVASNVLGVTTAGILNGFAYMSLGCIAFKVYQSAKEKSFATSLASVIFRSLYEIATLCLILIMVYRDGRTPKDFVLIMLFAILVVSAAMNNTVLAKICNNRFCVFLGEISYSLFLIHFAVLRTVKHYCKELIRSNMYRGGGYYYL